MSIQDRAKLAELERRVAVIEEELGMRKSENGEQPRSLTDRALEAVGVKRKSNDRR